MKLTMHLLPFAFVLVICTGGIFYRHYHDNTLQRMGLIALVLASTARIAAIIDGAQPSAIELTLGYGLALYLTGTAVKVAVRRRRALAA